MIADPSVDSKLPVLYWFVGDPSAAETTSGTRCSVFYDGILYDNVFVRSRGLTGTYWHKKSLKFDLNQGYHFQFSPDQEPVEEFNLNSTYSDKAYIRQVLAWETYRDAGSPYCISFPMRVQQNGAFYSVAIWVEQPDERYLERQGLDPKGAMYKMLLFNSLESAVVGVAKKTRLDEDHSDLQKLIDAINLPAQERTAYLYDHVNIPAVINYLAAATVILDRDFGHNNYYMYRDTEGTGEWMFLPWDKDLTFGRNYLHYQGGTFNDVIWADHDPESHPLSCYTSNYLIDALYDTRTIQEMYLRRLRTLMDELLQAPGTPASELHDEQRIDELVDQMLPDVILDAAHWPTWGVPQTFTEAVDIIKDDYLAVRRVHLYDTHGPANNGLVPEAQPANVNLDFGPIDVDPVSGDQDEEYFALVNHNSFAVDISAWKVAYDVEYTFQPGVVIPAGGTLYVSPNIVAFRNRTASPTGGEGHFVQGNYRGQLSNTWGVLKLYNTDARLVNVHVFFNRRRLGRP
jgi:hypothetical protein